MIYTLAAAILLCAQTSYITSEGKKRAKDKFDVLIEKNNQCAKRVPGKPCIGAIVLGAENHRSIICVKEIEPDRT
jgi:hypothetical protein